jgi:hypothetical protein
MFLFDSSVTHKSCMSACSLRKNALLKFTSKIPGDSILPEIPNNILGLIIAPLIRDRHTFNNLAATCKELRRTCTLMDPPPPWLEGRISLGSGIWYVHFWERKQKTWGGYLPEFAYIVSFCFPPLSLGPLRNLARCRLQRWAYSID